MMQINGIAASSFCGKHTRGLLATACCLGILASVSVADVVAMKDGRKVEGQILDRNDKTIEIDTAMAGCRATLRLKTEDVLSVEEKKLAPDFFDPNRQTAAVQASRPARGGTQYLEVPIVGKFGTDVVVNGVRTALAYADANKIRHVVFVIDSTGHYGVSDALEMCGLMLKFRGKITYHAVVKNCLGDGMVIAGMCNTVHMLPGSSIGGSKETGSTSRAMSPEDVAVFRAHIADLLAQNVVGRPGKERLLRAMIDPAQPMAGWRDPSGNLSIAASAPASLKPGELIFSSKEGEPLVLTADQIWSLGGPTFDGTVDDLGKALNIPDWRSAGDYGKEVVRMAADARKKRLKETQGTFEETIKENVSVRESLERSLERYIREAAKFDPTENSYDKLLARWDNGLGIASKMSQSDTGTSAVLGTWKYRADGALQYLGMAAQAALLMDRLEQEAIQLGIVPDYKPGELANIISGLAGNANAIREQKAKK